jgi:hypothetical protein
MLVATILSLSMVSCGDHDSCGGCADDEICVVRLSDLNCQLDSQGCVKKTPLCQAPVCTMDCTPLCQRDGTPFHQWGCDSPFCQDVKKKAGNSLVCQ